MRSAQLADGGGHDTAADSGETLVPPLLLASAPFACATGCRWHPARGACEAGAAQARNEIRCVVQNVTKVDLFVPIRRSCCLYATRPAPLGYRKVPTTDPGLPDRRFLSPEATGQPSLKSPVRESRMLASSQSMELILVLSSAEGEPSWGPSCTQQPISDRGPVIRGAPSGPLTGLRRVR